MVAHVPQHLDDAGENVVLSDPRQRNVEGAVGLFARSLVERLATEIALLVRRAFDDLGVAAADVVLGGGMLTRGEGLLHDQVVARLPEGARPVVLRDPPVLGAALAALDAAATTSDAGNRLRAALREHTDLANVRAG